MKTLFLILFITVSSFSFAQNRKSILKEINNYKHAFYSKASYDTTTFGLKLILNDYFIGEGYKVYLEKDSSVTFVKKITLIYTSEVPNGESQEKYKRDDSEFFVSNYITSINGLKKVVIETETKNYTEPFRPITNKRMLGTSHFNKLKLYQYLHQKFNKEKIILSKSLVEKIKAYNAKQKNKTKKIIVGKDY